MDTNIKQLLTQLKSTLPSQVTLVAVSKTKPHEDIMEAYECGQRIFGENRVQELLEKYDALPKDIKWHMIGHLQTKKVKSIIGKVDLIHGVDSIKLLSEIDKRSATDGVVTNCLLQVHIAEEQTKFGFGTNELLTLFNEGLFSKYNNVNIQGLMGMATFVDDPTQVALEFNQLKKLFKNINTLLENDLTILSMGMSGDYPIAIEQGSTMIRVGSKIFGFRN